MKFSRLPLIVVLMFLVLVGCAEKKEPVVELPPGPTITDSVLGIHIPELPLVWELIEDRPQGRLAVTDRAPRIGKVEAFLLEEDFGMNIFETIKAHQREIEGQPDGHYYGA
ncbi:MAG: hypothetical protein GY906_40740, partial [bacterium]|nr:hypothetical protein [bacterium]